MRIDQYGVDNSFSRRQARLHIRFGKGGVDDAEDAEVIVHEYGHAVHDAQVPGFGSSLDAGSIGESFGDYLAVSVGLAAAKQYGWPVKAEQACPMDWDSTSYTDGAALHPPLRHRPHRGDTRGRGALRRADLEPGALGDPPGLRRLGRDARGPGTRP